MIEVKKVGITKGDLKVLEDALYILNDYEVSDDCYKSRFTVDSLKRIVDDFKEELKWQLEQT